MAYNVYFLCDECGYVGANYTNRTVSYSRMEKIAKQRYGWHVSRQGKWVCPDCWKKLHVDTPTTEVVGFLLRRSRRIRRTEHDLHDLHKR